MVDVACVELIERRGHQKKASSSYKNEISKEEALTNMIYREDFETFGYELLLQSSFIPESVKNK